MIRWRRLPNGGYVRLVRLEIWPLVILAVMLLAAVLWQRLGG